MDTSRLRIHPAGLRRAIYSVVAMLCATAGYGANGVTYSDERIGSRYIVSVSTASCRTSLQFSIRQSEVDFQAFALSTECPSHDEELQLIDQLLVKAKEHGALRSPRRFTLVHDTDAGWSAYYAEKLAMHWAIEVASSNAWHQASVLSVAKKNDFALKEIVQIGLFKDLKEVFEKHGFRVSESEVETVLTGRVKSLAKHKGFFSGQPDFALRYAESIVPYNAAIFFAIEELGCGREVSSPCGR